MEYQAKLNETYMPVLHCISSLTGASYEKFFFVLLFSMSFYISRYHFLQLFLTLFNIVWKKIFLNGFTQNPPTPWPKSAKLDENVHIPYVL